MKKYQYILKKLNDVEREILSAFHEEIEKSNIKSKFLDIKVLKIDINGYIEMGVIDGRIKLIDNNGNYSSIYCINLDEMCSILMEL